MAKEPLIVYWAPDSVATNGRGEWNMLYDEPVNLYADMVKHKSPKAGENSWYACPAVSTRLKRSFVFVNNQYTEVSYDFSDNRLPEVTNTGYRSRGVSAKIARESAVINGSAPVLDLKWYFFAEEPVLAMTTPPFMHRPSYLEKGALLPGEFDISKWFRPFTAELQLWDNKGMITFNDKDPLFYLEVLTDRPVILKRFILTDRLHAYSVACASAPLNYGRHLPLADRYKRFMDTRTNELVLKEIKSNLL